MQKVFFIHALILFLAPNLFAQTCEFFEWETYQGTSILRTTDTTAYLYTSAKVHIDADGAPNAYHPDDIGLHCTRGEGFKGLDCPANAGYPNASWWRNVLVQDPENPSQAFIQKSGPTAGYFVSKTALINASVEDATDPKRYVDASTVPYLVFPGAFYRMRGTGRMGDMGLAINLTNGKSSPFVVADVGPTNAKLGEISLFLASQLGGENPNPRTGQGTPRGEILFVIFPYSSKSHPWPQSLPDLENQVTKRIKQLGGLEALLACF